jgi:hypothetical protein
MGLSCNQSETGDRIDRIELFDRGDHEQIFRFATPFDFKLPEHPPMFAPFDGASVFNATVRHFAVESGTVMDDRFRCEAARNWWNQAQATRRR